VIRVFVTVRVELRRIRRVRKKLLFSFMGGADLGSKASLLLRRQGRAASTRMGFVRRAEGTAKSFVQAAHWPISFSGWVATVFSLAVGSGVMVFLLGSGATTILAAAVCGAAFPIVVLVSRVRSLAKQIEAQLPDALDMMARATQVGHSIGRSVAQVADEMPDPVSKELRITANEIALSNDAPRAFRSFATRVKSSDARFLALAVAVQDEAGGSLVGTLRRLSAIIRNRAKLRTRIESIIAGPRFTVRTLLAFPVFVFLVIQINNPELLLPLWEEEAGQRLLMMSTLGVVMGVLSARYLSRVKT